MDQNETAARDRLWDAIEDALGHNDSNMSRDRPYDGQSWTDGGARGAVLIKGVTLRDLRDAYVRAYCLSMGCVDSANMPFYNEALKGEQAALCSNDLFSLKGDVDPMAVAQNLSCEIERLMGIFPNIPENDDHEVSMLPFSISPSGITDAE